MWHLELKPAARRTLAKLNPQLQQRIQHYLDDLLQTDNPRSKGEALQGPHGLWRYRIGDYRIIASIQDERITVIVLKIGHRGKVYDSLPKPIARS